MGEIGPARHCLPPPGTHMHMWILQVHRPLNRCRIRWTHSPGGLNSFPPQPRQVPSMVSPPPFIALNLEICVKRHVNRRSQVVVIHSLIHSQRSFGVHFSHPMVLRVFIQLLHLPPHSSPTKQVGREHAAWKAWHRDPN